MRSRRSVLRAAGAAGGLAFAGQVTAREPDGERLDVQQTETALVTVDRRLTDVTIPGPEESIRNRHAFTEGGDGTVYVSESEALRRFDPRDQVAVADSTDRLVSTDAGNRISLTGNLQPLLTPDGAVTGRIDETVTLETTERPGTGVTVTGGGVSATVAPGETETVEVTGTFRRSTPSGEIVRENTTVQLTVEHHGVRELIAHPTAKLVPGDHRLGRLAAEAYSRQSDSGSLPFERSTFEVRYDSRGFFAHEEVETHIGSPDVSASAQAPDTNALIIGTKKYGGKPTNGRDAFENVINSDTNAYVNVSADSGVDLGSPDTFDDAWNSVKNSSRVESELNSYDCVMVVDDRSFSGSTTGIAFVGTAGGSFGFGYCESENLGTVVHECGHVYGCSHSEPTTHWRRFGVLRHDVMGYSGVDPDCQGDKPGYLRDRSYRACTADRINEYINNQL